MKIPARSILLCVGWLVVHLAGGPVWAESVQEKIQRLCAEAAAAPTKTMADSKLDQAQTEFEASQSMIGSLEHGFLQNEIKHTRGFVCITFWQRNRENTAWRDEGRRWLSPLVDAYDRLAARGEDEADAIANAVGQDESKLAKHAGYRTAEGSIWRANYKKAWTEYLLGIAAAEPNAREARLSDGL